MLILTRKVGEAVIVDGDITIRLLEVKGGQVKLGVDAPGQVAIHREEVYLRILEENKKAAMQAGVDDLEALSAIFPQPPAEKNRN